MSFITAALFCGAILWALLRTGWAWSLATDVPTHRSLHTRPTPRVGGWGIAPVCTVGIAYVAPQLAYLCVVVIALAGICQIDDRQGLSARVRFLVQTVAAITVLVLFVRLPAPWGLWFWPILLLGILWTTNLYNFMDGADGLAAGMTIIGFAAYGLAASAYVPSLAAAAMVVSGAGLGFLFFNWPPAKMFMGDAGSIPLGFLVASFGLIGWSARVWAIWFPIMLFMPFIADASVTLARRLLRGERVWEAHREHYYQRMIQMDEGHGGTIRAWYVLMLVGAGVALLVRQLIDRGTQQSVTSGVALALIWLIVLVTLGVGVDRCWSRFNSNDK